MLRCTLRLFSFFHSPLGVDELTCCWFSGILSVLAFQKSLCFLVFLINGETLRSLNIIIKLS